MTFPILSFRNLVWYKHISVQSSHNSIAQWSHVANGYILGNAALQREEISEVSLEESQYLEAGYKKKLESRRTTKKENITEVRE